MLRNTLLWAAENPFLAKKLPTYRFVQKATKRFMPGEDRDAALIEAKALSSHGISATTTLLGENLVTLDEADGVVEHYRTTLREIESRGLDVEISIKPTQLGLDFGVDEARKRLGQLADATDSLVWVDMEGSDYVDATLDIFRTVKEEKGNVGLCIQSYLHRTADDLEALLPLDPDIRIVKGAYNEPPEIAFPKKSDVDGARHARPQDDRGDEPDRLRARPGQGSVRVRHALRHPARRADTPGEDRPPGTRAGELRFGMVPVVHASTRRTPG